MYNQLLLSVFVRLLMCFVAVCFLSGRLGEAFLWFPSARPLLSSRPAIWYSHYLVFARIPNITFSGIRMYSHPQNDPFLASWGAWLEHESILDTLNRQLSPN